MGWTYRRKETEYGNLMDVEYYPIDTTRRYTLRQRRGKTREQQQAANERRARKRFIRKLIHNFGRGDLLMTLDYRRQPTPEQAMKDVRAYVIRLNAWRRKQGMERAKYMYVIEWAGKEGEKKRIHIHMIIDAMDRDAAEQLWDKGRANSKRAQPDQYDLSAWASYMVKTEKSRRLWGCSKGNLREPEERRRDRAIRKRLLERLARDWEEARSYLEEKYPAYEFLDMEARENQYIAGVYLSARMRRRE